MKYICLVSLALLFVSIASQCEAGLGNQTICNAINVTESLNKTGFKCCWIQGKPKNDSFSFDNCTLTEISQFEEMKKAYEGNMTDLVYDCSSKYLYVASLFALLFML